MSKYPAISSRETLANTHLKPWYRSRVVFANGVKKRQKRRKEVLSLEDFAEEVEAMKVDNDVNWKYVSKRIKKRRRI